MTRSLIRVPAALTLLLSLAAFETIDSPYEAVALANRAYAEARYREAGELYEAALSQLPDSAGLHYDYGNAFFRLHDLEKAQAEYMRALDTDDGALAARVHYNLGNVHYQRSLNAMRTFRDAMTPIREAMDNYREALELDPQIADAMYNLELADRLYDELKAQRVQPQANPEARDRKGSANRGQDFEKQADAQREQSDQDQTKREGTPQGEMGEVVPEGTPTAQQTAETTPGGRQRDLTAKEAEQVVEMVRDRARAAEALRQQWREAHMRDEAIERPW